MADLKIAAVSKHFGQTAAVRDLNIDMASGEFVVLLGPSGAGKTTTLRLVAGLETPDSGQVWINGRDVTQVAPALRDVTFVFQQYSLYPHLSVYDNLAFPLRSPLRKTSEDDIRAKVTEVARMLRMEDKLQNPATRLSGGQMQRVAIGRALVRNPAVYLMDEPLSSLDAKLRNDLRLELKRIQQDTQATMLYVTHDQVEALTLATRIGVLDHGQLVQLGTPQQVYEDPASVAVASRLGSPRINLLPRAALAYLQVPETVTTLGVRAEHIQVCHPDTLAQANAQARVERIERLSDQYLLHLSLPGSEQGLIASAHPGELARPGEDIHIHIAHSLWFDAGGQRVRH
ncbi:ABC transporter ATP-binding protein [Rhodoferax sp.]|uniref:ABC transporter ATP-binding protein n=1 Tax=Rhodoferax sp. TaxID=50421 RepID=UPI002611145D|nr:ABC transporter ATP-binding protein [Rhodoferax sp.]MDD2924608.1 ABC transporter ATP-binding protein [Rhodoferax sp.]